MTTYSKGKSGFHLLNGTNTSDLQIKAIVRSISQKEASAFLHSLAVDPDSTFTNEEFQICMAMRFILPLHDGSLTGKYCCRTPHEMVHLDRAGLHLLTCGAGSGIFNVRMFRHTIMCIRLVEMLKEAGCPDAYRECQAPSRDGKKLDFSTHMLLPKKHIMGDFTVAAPFCSSYVKQAAKRRGYAASVLTKNKFRTYGEECQRQQVTLLPVAMESHGYMSKELIGLISNARNKIREMNTYRSDIKAKEFNRRWKMKLSTTFMKHTAKCVIYRVRTIRSQYGIVV